LNLTNFNVSILLLMALTVFIAGVRIQKPVDNNWVLLYWVLITALTVVHPDDLFDFRVVGIGLLASLLLRFEFMNRTFARFVMFVETVVWAYILYTSWITVTS
jgi:hypothetical protein